MHPKKHQVWGFEFISRNKIQIIMFVTVIVTVAVIIALSFKCINCSICELVLWVGSWTVWETLIQTNRDKEKLIHRHSLDIRSNPVHTGRTPVPRSCGGKDTDHTDRTHLQPHRLHHSDTLRRNQRVKKDSNWAGQIILTLPKLKKTMQSCH